MTKRKCTKTIYEINNLGESYFVSQLKTILRSHDCDIETLKKQITDGIVVKDFTVDGILPDENGDFKTGYGERIKELEENTSEVKVDTKSISFNEEGELTTDINTDTTNKTERLLEDNYNKMLSANKGSDGFNSNETLSFSGYNYSLNSQIENSYVTKNEILSPGYYSNLISSSTGQKDFNIQTTISNDSYEENISFKNEGIFYLSIGIDRKSFSVGKENVAFSVDNIKADINGNISTDYENRITELEKRPTIVGDGKSIRVGADGVVKLGYKTGTGIGAPELIKGVYTFEHPTTDTNKLHLNPATGVSIQSYEDRISYTGDFSSKSFIFNVDGKTSKYSFEDITIGNNKIKFPKADESILPTKWLDNYIPLIVDGKVANEFGVLETGYEDRIVALENTPSGINPENIGFGLSYKDDKIQLGERLEGLGVEANQIYKEGAYTILGDFKGFQEGKERTIIISEDSKVTVSTRNDANTSSLEINPYLLSFGITGGKNFSGFSIGDNILQFKVNDKIIGYNPSNNSMVYNNGEFNGEIATITFVEDYVSKNMTSEVGKIYEIGESKYRALEYKESALILTQDFNKVITQNMGAAVMVSDEQGTVNFGYNNENGTNQAFVNDEGFTMQKQHNSGRLSSISVEDGAIKLALQNPVKSNTYLRLDNEEILMSSIYKKYNPNTEEYESTLMEGSVASAKYVDTKVEELTAIIEDLQKQIEELKK